MTALVFSRNCRSCRATDRLTCLPRRDRLLSLGDETQHLFSTVIPIYLLYLFYLPRRQLFLIQQLQVLLVRVLLQLRFPHQLPRFFRTRDARIKCRQPKNRLQNCLYLLARLVFRRAVALRFRVCLRSRVLYLRRTQVASLLR